MNQFLLKQCAKNLKEILLKYESSDEEVKLLHQSLVKFIDDSCADKVLNVMESRLIPGRYFFDEGGLGKYRDLGDAYAKFVSALSYGELPESQELTKKIERLRNELLKGIEK